MARKRSRRRRILVYTLVVVIALLAAAAFPAYGFITRDEPATYSSLPDAFKYGSAGTEADQGFPYDIWQVLPTVFSDLLPPGPGKGWERFGFIYEPGHDRPIGVSFRKKPIGLVGINCALCHTATMRPSVDAPRRIVLGAPAAQFRLDEYITFLRKVGRDKRFDADTLMPAIEKRYHLSLAERMFYRFVVIPETKKGLEKVDRDFKWMDHWPAPGPGRVSTFTGWKVHFHFKEDKNWVGTSDFPSIWDQRIRKDVASHWDGNNKSLLERNISASMAVGATKDSVDVKTLEKVGGWLLDLQPPKFPASRIDQSLAARGGRIYEANCSACHDPGGASYGQVDPLPRVGTDPERVNSFSQELVDDMNTLGAGKPWAFSHFRKTNGYVNGPLDGIWLRAPYLHNGSVPNLRALLFPKERPATFFTGYDVYDWKNLGYVSAGARAKRHGFRYDTRLRGNHNTGHTYGADLPAADKLALLEYLKTK